MLMTYKKTRLALSVKNATKVKGNICRMGRLLNVIVASEKEMTDMIVGESSDESSACENDGDEDDDDDDDGDGGDR